MEHLSRCILVAVFVLFEILVLGQTTPVWNPQTSPGLGRNIRHLPCVSRRTGESGVCMFAISCAKANGTHLGTCIDRFYFGSCCKLALPDNLAEPLDSNHIYEETPSHSVPVVEAPSPSPSSSPVPLLSSSPAPTTAYTSPYSASITAVSSTENYHISTFQSVQTVKNTTQTPVLQSTTTPRTTESTTHKPTKKPTTSKPTTLSSSFTHKPTSSNKPPVSKPHNQSSTVKPKPPSKPSQKPPSTNKPLTKPPVSTKPPNKVPIKPSKPSNTTVSKPPQKPSNGTISKPSKPSPTKRPTGSNTPKPSLKPTSKPQTKPTSGKPQTKPPLKPVPVVTSAPPTDPNYVQLPVVTVPTSSKPPVDHQQSTTISNDVVQRPTSNNSVEAEEENSNVIQENLHTTSSPLLVTWTTVDEKPLPPLPKPSSTAPAPAPLPANNETSSTTSSQTWVQVSMSTPGPSTAEHTSSSESAVNSTESAPPSAGASAAPGSTSAPSSEASGSEITTPTPTVESLTNTSTSTSTGVNTTDLIIQNEISSLNLNMTNYQDVCGRRLFPQSRIVGGDKASFGKWPWQISLRQWRTSTYLHKCGAALLNENWAITAAHCVENVAPSDLLLRLGEHDLSLEDEPYGYQERRVQIVASHPQFDPRTFEYDLALLRFYEPVTFQPNIIPVCVPQDDTNFVGSTAYVTGWGRLYEDGPLPSVLQEVSVPVINNTVCETMYRAAGYIEHIPEIFICAGWKKGGFDSCEGDSGGPMVIQRPDKRWLLAGVISWGIGCAEPNQPGVYTRISEFRGWINQILQF